MFIGKKALVTGATSGIGKAIAVALAAQGVEVLVAGRSNTKLQATADHIRSESEAQVSTVKLDLATFDKSDAKILNEKIGELDILVHCAGVLINETSFDDADINDLDLQYYVNLRSPLLLTQSLLPALRKSQGQIVFINSSAAQQKAKLGAFSYTITKYGLTALADGLRDQVNAEGIRVISVYPGKTATAMQEQIYQAQGRAYVGDNMLQPEDVAGSVLSALGQSRTAEVTDVAIRPFLKE